jgi:hypothetical protein
VSARPCSLAEPSAKRTCAHEELAPIETMPPEIMQRIFRLLDYEDKVSLLRANKRVFFDSCSPLRPKLLPRIKTQDDVWRFPDDPERRLCATGVSMDALLVYNLSLDMMRPVRRFARLCRRFQAVIIVGVHADSRNSARRLNRLAELLSRCDGPFSQVFCMRLFFIAPRDEPLGDSTLRDLRQLTGKYVTDERRLLSASPVCGPVTAPSDLDNFSQCYIVSELRLLIKLRDDGTYDPHTCGTDMDLVLATLARPQSRCLRVTILLQMDSKTQINGDVLHNYHRAAHDLCALVQQTGCIERCPLTPQLLRLLSAQDTYDFDNASTLFCASLYPRCWYAALMRTDCVT